MADKGELLTDDELADRRRPARWQGATRDIPTTIRALAKLHGLAGEEVIDESESWYDFVDELTTVIQQLSAATPDTDIDTEWGNSDRHSAA